MQNQLDHLQQQVADLLKTDEGYQALFDEVLHGEICINKMAITQQPILFTVVYATDADDPVFPINDDKMSFDECESYWLLIILLSPFEDLGLDLVCLCAHISDVISQKQFVEFLHTIIHQYRIWSRNNTRLCYILIFSIMTDLPDILPDIKCPIF